MEQNTKGEWGFKALKQIVKIRYKFGQNDEMLQDYRCVLIMLVFMILYNNGDESDNRGRGIELRCYGTVFLLSFSIKGSY